MRNQFGDQFLAIRASRLRGRLMLPLEFDLLALYYSVMLLYDQILYICLTINYSDNLCLLLPPLSQRFGVSISIVVLYRACTGNDII